MEERKKVEAVLFAVGDKIEEEEIARLTKLDTDTVRKALEALKQEYKDKESTFILINEGTKWKLTVREDYMPIVQRIVPKTELSRPVLETLAVIAWKSPVLQSDIINIRSSKAYEHIGELESVGFITKQKYGRSFMLRLSQQFYEYFDIKSKEDVKQIFKDVNVPASPPPNPMPQNKEEEPAEKEEEKSPTEEEEVPPEDSGDGKQD